MRWLLLGIVLVSLLPGLVGIAALVYRMSLDDRVQIEIDMVRTARGLTQTLDAELARARAVALALATSSHLVAHDLAGFHRRARALLETEGIGHNIMLSDAHGQQVLNTLVPIGTALLGHGDPSLGTRSFDAPRPLVSDVFISKTTGQPIVTVDVPVMAAGRVVYGLSLVLAPQDFDNILRNYKLPAGWIGASPTAAEPPWPGRPCGSALLAQRPTRNCAVGCNWRRKAPSNRRRARAFQRPWPTASHPHRVGRWRWPSPSRFSLQPGFEPCT